MIYLGKKNTLKAHQQTEAGMMLIDDNRNEVLLPNKYMPGYLKVGDMIDVCVYRDSGDWLTATTIKPFIEIYGFAYLNARAVTSYGAFLDWGIEKDMLVPFKEQLVKMEEGKSYVVHMYLDEDTQRLIGSSNIQKFLSNENLDIQLDDEVDVLVFENSPIGYLVVVNNQFKGLIYHNEVYKKINVGDRLIGYVKNIKEGNALDISLQKIGFKHVLSSTDFILDVLHKNKGFINLSDNSSPQEIMEKLSMSKKTFKKAIGILYREQLVRIENDGVYLVR